MKRQTITLFLLALLLVGCAQGQTPSPTAPPAEPPDQGWIEINRVQVQAGSAVIVEGGSSLPDGSCLQTELQIDGQPAAWWPQNCIPVQSRHWELQVPLNAGGAPADLDPGASYLVRAWQQDHPSLVSQPFYFDLSGPPTPNSP